MGEAIFPHPRRVDALKLFQRFYPALLWDVLPLDDWTDILRYFLRQVELDRGIEMDWVTMDDLYHWANEDYPEDEEEEDPDWEPTGLEYLALALKVIPVESFGFDDEGFRGTQIEDYPVMLLLSALLEPGGHQLPRGREFYFLENLGDWDQEDKEQALKRLSALDTSRLPAPLSWLPEMGLYACGETGNDLLDTAPDFEKWLSWYTWDELDTVCRLYAEAKLVRERMELFNAWACDGGGDCTGARLMQITNLVIGREL